MVTMPEIPVYVIDIANIRSEWIGNPSNVRQAIQELVTPKGYKVNHISSLEELDTLVRNPPDNIVLINAHGEVVPLPKSWKGNWQDYFVALGNNVKDHGWVFVSITGYPFFYYAHDMARHEVTGSLGFMGENGLNYFLSVVDANANCRAPAIVKITEQGLKAGQNVGLDLPLEFGASRCAMWRNVKPAKIFYESGALCGASAIPIGKGFFVQNGIGSMDFKFTSPTLDTDRFFGYTAIAFTLSIVKPIVRKKRKIKKISTRNVRRNVPRARYSVGEPINFRGMVYAPLNEAGVVILFSKIMKDLGFFYEASFSGFPDAALRKKENHTFELIYAEFEYKSRNFVTHKHDPNKCDMIICWEHNWKDCPLEVIELKKIIKTLSS